MIPRQLSVIYCDDVRQELNGKIMLIGCYNTEMFVNSLPFNLGKLACSFSLRLPLEDKAKIIKIVVEINDEIVTETPEIDLEKMVFSEKEHAFAPSEKMFGGVLTIANHKISEPSVIRLVAMVDEETVVGNKLIVTPAPMKQ